MAKYKLVEKVEHIYTTKHYPHTDWYLLKCGHEVAVIQSDMRRKKCRCYYCCGEPYNKPLVTTNKD